MIKTILQALRQRKETLLLRSITHHETTADELEASCRIASRVPWWVLESIAKHRAKAAADRIELQQLREHTA